MAIDRKEQNRRLTAGAKDWWEKIIRTKDVSEGYTPAMQRWDELPQEAHVEIVADYMGG